MLSVQPRRLRLPGPRSLSLSVSRRFRFFSARGLCVILVSCPGIDSKGGPSLVKRIQNQAVSCGWTPVQNFCRSAVPLWRLPGLKVVVLGFQSLEEGGLLYFFMKLRWNVLPSRARGGKQRKDGSVNLAALDFQESFLWGGAERTKIQLPFAFYPTDYATHLSASQNSSILSSGGRMVVRKWWLPSFCPKPLPGVVAMPVASSSSRQYLSARAATKQED